jgi:hypothetical protein
MSQELIERLRLEAQIHAQEARTANATIAEIYQLCSGGKGEPVNWHGAEPVRALIAERDQLAATLRQQAESDHDFKNFHRLLCERFGYAHDEKDWKRDQLSLIEWIARQQAGRVDEDEGFDPRKFVRHMAEVLEAGGDMFKIDADLARLGAAIQAAIAQNTQPLTHESAAITSESRAQNTQVDGEAVETLNELYSAIVDMRMWLRDGQTDKAMAGMEALDSRFFSLIKKIANVDFFRSQGISVGCETLHAERARVPALRTPEAARFQSQFDDGDEE